MADTQNQKEKREYPALPAIIVRGNVAFPHNDITIELARSFSIKALEITKANSSEILLVTQKNEDADIPKSSDIFKMGTVCRIKSVSINEKGRTVAVFEGIARARVASIFLNESFFLAAVEPKKERLLPFENGIALELLQDIGDSVARLRKICPSIPEEVAKNAAGIKDQGHFADYLASNVIFNVDFKQEILNTLIPSRRMEKLAIMLKQTVIYMESDVKIHGMVKESLEERHKEMYLREQLNAIQHELGEDSDDLYEYQEKIEKLAAPKEIKEKLTKELQRLSKTPFGSAENTVLRNYLDICLEIPYETVYESDVTIEEAEKILDSEHEGLEKVKERILEYIAVRHLTKSAGNQIICLIGPPGVGKTSVARSVANALGRKYARVSLGGIRDEADIRGHRKTYVGAMPGRIIDAIIESKAKNPVIVLDELDKIASDSRGDPASALLEVLDPEQNKYFRDHFVEMPTDLSDCIFIATANGYDGIPSPLLDRMEIIDIESYSASQKLEIAKKHLIPKQIAQNGLNSEQIVFSDSAINEIIDEYTKEAGVRNLERKISSLCRKVARKILSEKIKSVTLDKASVIELLGSHRIETEEISENDLVGVVNGLAYTQAGGDMLKIEAVVMDGSGKTEITGSLGDVMKESARIAYSYVRSISDKLGINTKFDTKDIHIHCPEGAVPKDGPSAGVTMMCAIASAFSGMSVRHDIAMTGELSLTGRVLPIGGLREKATAAYIAGAKTVLIPAKNKKNIEEVDPAVAAHLNFVCCETAEDVLRLALNGYSVTKTDSEPSPIEIPTINLHTVSRHSAVTQ